MKKTLKILISSVVIVTTILIATPYFFKDKIVHLVKKSINKNVNAKVDFTDVDISLLSNFPQSTVNLNNLVITTFEPFSNDTLASIKKISLKIPLASLLKVNSGNIIISHIAIEEAQISILKNEQGKANYDISKSNNEVSAISNKNSKNEVSLYLEGYQIVNSTILYHDIASKTFLELNNFNHLGSGNFATSVSNLQTETNTLISFKLGDELYLDKNSISLDAVLNIDLNQNKYTFLENSVLINQLPLVFDGFIKLNVKQSRIRYSFQNTIL